MGLCRVINHVACLWHSLHVPHINLAPLSALNLPQEYQTRIPFSSPLGFLKTRSSNPPGNLGVQDIIAALRWTKENIAAFGGDPNRITIVGQDTGAALANLILISKEAKGEYANK